MNFSGQLVDVIAGCIFERKVNSAFKPIRNQTFNFSLQFLLNDFNYDHYACRISLSVIFEEVMKNSSILKLKFVSYKMAKPASRILCYYISKTNAST